VAVVFDGFDGLNLFGHAGVMRKQFNEGARAFFDVLRLLDEEFKKIVFARQKPLQKSWHVVRLPRRAVDEAGAVERRRDGGGKDASWRAAEIQVRESDEIGRRCSKDKNSSILKPALNGVGLFHDGSKGEKVMEMAEVNG